MHVCMHESMCKQGVQTSITVSKRPHADVACEKLHFSGTGARGQAK